MTIKSIELAYEKIYDFLDAIDSHPLSAQISLPVPDLIDEVWIDKYFVYENVAVNGKHIAYAPNWIFIFLDGQIFNQYNLKESDSIAEYTLPVDAKSTEALLGQYIECYDQIQSLRPTQKELLNNDRVIINQFLEVFKKVIPKEIIAYYVATSKQLRQWLCLTDNS